MPIYKLDDIEKGLRMACNIVEEIDVIGDALSEEITKHLLDRVEKRYKAEIDPPMAFIGSVNDDSYLVEGEEARGVHEAFGEVDWNSSEYYELIAALDKLHEIQQDPNAKTRDEIIDEILNETKP